MDDRLIEGQQILDNVKNLYLTLVNDGSVKYTIYNEIYMVEGLLEMLNLEYENDEKGMRLWLISWF